MPGESQRHKEKQQQQQQQQQRQKAQQRASTIQSTKQNQNEVHSSVNKRSNFQKSSSQQQHIKKIGASEQPKLSSDLGKSHHNNSSLKSYGTLAKDNNDKNGTILFPSRRSSQVLTKSSLSVNYSQSNDNRNSNSRNVLIAFDRAKIYTYNANPPSLLRRTSSIDSKSVSSLRRVDSIDSIRSNITEILSNEGDDAYNEYLQSPPPTTGETGTEIENNDTSSIKSRGKSMSSKGRLAAHGVFQIYEIESGITYMSCGGGNKTTRETFVHPLLPRLKIFRINNLTFMLMLSHPERFWKIVLEMSKNELTNYSNLKSFNFEGNNSDFYLKIDKLEQIFKKTCCYVDMFPASQSRSQSSSPSLSPLLEPSKQGKLQESVEIVKQDGNINSRKERKHSQGNNFNITDIHGSSVNTNRNSSQRSGLSEDSKHKVVDHSNRKNKSHLGNRLSKLFKPKSKLKSQYIKKDEIETSQGLAGETWSSPSNSSPTVRTNSIGNSSSGNLLKIQLDNPSAANTDYNEYITKIVEQKIEQKMRVRLQQENFQSPTKIYSEADGETQNIKPVAINDQDEPPKGAEMVEPKKTTRNITKNSGHSGTSLSSASSVTSSSSSLDSALLNIIKETGDDELEDLDYPNYLHDLTQKLNNDVNDEIFQHKRKSLVTGQKDAIMSRFQNQIKVNDDKPILDEDSKGVHHEARDNRKSSLYINTSSWMDVNDNGVDFANQNNVFAEPIMAVKPVTGQIGNDEAYKIKSALKGKNSVLFSAMQKQSSQYLLMKDNNNTKVVNNENCRGSVSNRSQRSFVYYQPHSNSNLNDDVRSAFTTRTYAYRRNGTANANGLRNQGYNNGRDFNHSHGYVENGRHGQNDDIRSYYSLKNSIFGGGGGGGRENGSVASKRTNGVNSREIYSIIMNENERPHQQVQQPTRSMSHSDFHRYGNSNSDVVKGGLLSKVFGWY